MSYTIFSTLLSNINLSIIKLQEREESISIDDALIALATPVVQYEGPLLQNKYSVIKSISDFLKGKNIRSRYKLYIEASVQEALKAQWLTQFEEIEEKVKMLKEFVIIEDVDIQNDIVTLDSSRVGVYKGLRNVEKYQYGTQLYQVPQKKVRKHSNKDEWDELPYEDCLFNHIRKALEIYKEHWTELNDMETYKWDAYNTFHANFDLKATNFHDMLEKSLADAQNLLTSKLYFAYRMILKLSDTFPCRVQESFTDLYLGNDPLGDRVARFHKTMKDLTSDYDRIYPKENGQKRNSYQDVHAISVYLAMYDPQQYYIFKSSSYYEFLKRIGLKMPSLGTVDTKLVRYKSFCDTLRKILSEDDQFINLHKSTHPEDKSFSLATQDFIYCVSCYNWFINCL